MNFISFNTFGTDPQQNEIIPAGSYNAIITKIDVKSWNTDEEYLSLFFKIINHETLEGRMAFITININDSDPTKREKNIKRLDQICTICNVESINGKLNLDDLCSKPMYVRFGIYKTKKGKEYNSLYNVGQIKDETLVNENEQIFSKTGSDFSTSFDNEEDPF